MALCPSFAEDLRGHVLVLQLVAVGGVIQHEGSKKVRVVRVLGIDADVEKAVRTLARGRIHRWSQAPHLAERVVWHQFDPALSPLPSGVSAMPVIGPVRLVSWEVVYVRGDCVRVIHDDE